MEQQPQNFANHTRWVPLYHFAAAGIVAINILYAIYRLARYPSGGAGVGLLLSLAIAIIYWYSRAFPLAVQDRVIRLEERLRIERLCPGAKSRIEEIKVDQLVALRFASDEELPELVSQVLEGKLKSRVEIKKAIRNWRPDHLRV